jgi:tRNA dimethylallyltransferase
VKPLVVIAGPTASGKTRLAAMLAARADGEIISADSRQVYRRMDIGTGKDLAEYTVGSLLIPYHLIDILQPGERYNINEFYTDFRHALDQIRQRNKLTILCGGSGLYLQTAIEGNPLSAIPVNEDLRNRLIPLDKAALTELWNQCSDFIRENTDPSTAKRMMRAIEMDEFLRHHPAPEARPLTEPTAVFALANETRDRWEAISVRLRQRLEAGLIEEVKALLDEGLSPDQLRYYGLEYLWVTDFLMGKITRERMTEGLDIAIRQFAKRQMTFFRKMEKDGIAFRWLRPEDGPEHNCKLIVKEIEALG